MRLLFLLLALVAQVAFAQITVTPWTAKFPGGGERFNKGLAEIDTNGPMTLVIRPCGTVNAWFDGNATIVFCKELIDQTVSLYSTMYQRLGGRLSAESATALAAGAIHFTVFHEIGHALIKRHHIPIAGREEDAADQFAAFLLIQVPRPEYLIGAFNFFVDKQQRVGLFDNMKRYSDAELTNEHSLDLQRRAQLICWGYGKAPQVFAPYAANMNITADRLQRCPREYSNMMDSSKRLFGQYVGL